MNNQIIDKTVSGQILIVDDTPANLKMLTTILSSHGYQVRRALSGSRALSSVAARSPDLILLDIRMEEMDGYEVCRLLKGDEKNREIPVIFISALHETEDKMRGFEAGGVDYITKPFQSKEVLARIEVHLTLQRQQKQLEVQNMQLQREISRRERTEGELRRHKVHLEELVTERTRQLNMKVRELEGRDQLVHFQMTSPDVETGSLEVLRILSDVLEIEKSSIYFPSTSGTELESVISANIPFSKISDEGKLHPDEALSLAIDAFQQKKVVLGNNHQMAAPIIYNEDILGVIWVSCDGSQEKNDDGPNIFWRMATEAGTVLRMAKFKEHLQRDDVDLEKLLDLTD